MHVPLAMASVVIPGHQVRHLSLLGFFKEAMSLGSWVVKNQIEPLCVTRDLEPFLIPRLGRRDELDHGVGRLGFSHDGDVTPHAKI